tara:strand:+ start:602 stop:859 length:258 start_codon:yes stop_codon:yes gene_type:complete
MMKFKFVNEGSRGEVDITFGDIEVLNELVNSYVVKREKLLLEEDGDVDYVNEFMDMEFGGISEDCFVELSFGEEDSVLVYVVEEK